MTKKIFRSIISVTLVVLTASMFITFSFLYDYFNKSQVAQLKEELSLVAGGVEKLGTEYFDDYDSSVFRFTLVAADGSVIYDSKANSADLENHKSREEIAEAFESGNGSSARYSSTLTEKTFYEAVLLSNGNVLRVSENQVTVGALFLGMLPVICAIIIVSAAVTLFMSQKMAKSIVKPFNELDLENPDKNDTYEELSPILTKINRQHKQIERQLCELKQKSDEFEQITDSMNEGLVLLDKNGTVISINASAKKIFGVPDTAAGRFFLTVDRNIDINNAVKAALTGNRTELREERDGRIYQFIVSRTESNGQTLGVVILCFDITETAFAERNRRQFTANVSHELKTPLQSIIGSTELLQNGLVKPEDTERFIANIKNESTRLVTLINDIIELSRLDENNTSASEAVDLYTVAYEVAEVLQPSAYERKIEIVLNCEHCILNGIREYFYEIIYNLCDNAIRYNKDGGKVIIDIKNNDNNIILSVTDTGIGIPPEHQQRIFERFYRVDESHSRDTGGTGLGLSIVKHAVEYHKGKIYLDSTVGAGTTVKIVF